LNILRKTIKVSERYDTF